MSVTTSGCHMRNMTLMGTRQMTASKWCINYKLISVLYSAIEKMQIHHDIKKEDENH